MNQGSRVCSFCGALNGRSERRCYRCDRPLPNERFELISRAIRSVLGDIAPATRLMVILCLANFALCLVDQADYKRVFTELLGSGFDRSVLLRFGALGGTLGREEPFRYLSAVFVHFGILHLVLNMLALVQLGARIEQRFGAARFVVIFTLAGGIGFLISDIYYGVAGPMTAGASGSIFGLVGAYIAELHVRKDPALKEVLLRVIAFTLAFVLFFSVNNAAHLGGFAVGYGVGRLLEAELHRHRYDRPLMVVAVLCVAANVGSIVLASQSPIWSELRRLEVRHGLR